jgi:phage-related protein (TIGR01555 family)
MRLMMARRSQTSEEVLTNDGWDNVLTGLGDMMRDAKENTTWKRSRRIGYRRLDNIYAQNSLAAKVIDIPAIDMTREWIELYQKNQGDAGEMEAAVEERMDELEVRQSMCKAIKWAYLYGGALLIMGIRDGSDDPSKPLNEDNIQDIVKLDVIDRFQTMPGPIVADVASPYFGLPEYYEVFQYGAIPVVRGKGQRIHASRVIRFDGMDVPDRLRLETLGWAWSRMDRLMPEIRNFGSSVDYLVNLIKDANIDVFQIENLAKLLENGKSEDIKERFRLIAQCKSILGGVIIGMQEKYERRSVALAGLVELLREFKEGLSAAVDIPTTRFWGRSPAGMNATGESDIVNYYDGIHGQQEDVLRKRIRRILRLIELEKNGPIGKKVGMKFAFCSLWQVDPKTKADIYLAQSTADTNYIKEGVVTPEEVALSRFGLHKGDIQIVEELRREALDMLSLKTIATELKPEPVQPTGVPPKTDRADKRTRRASPKRR